MKKIKIKFSGFGIMKFEDTAFYKILSKKYKIELSDNPEYLIYDITSTDYLKYSCVKIFYTAENIVPDFNVCDYAIGFHYMDIQDRYFRLPNYLLEGYAIRGSDNYKKDLDLANCKHTQGFEELYKEKLEFCNFIYSNSSADPIRDDFFHALSIKEKVSSGGWHLNNTGLRVNDKLEYQKKFRFSIAFENSLGCGYTTEKIIQAFAAGTIPIYWGNPLVEKDFNPKAFININDYRNFEEAIEKILEINSSKEKWIEIMKEPAFKNPNFCLEKSYELEKFLLNIFEQDLESAYRRNRVCWGIRHERKLIYGAYIYFILSKLSTSVRKIDRWLKLKLNLKNSRR